MTTVVLSTLVINANLRQVCNGCTEILEQRGLVTRIGTTVINQRQPEFVHAVFQIADGHTLADCQEAIGARHKGNHGEKWGE